MRARLCQWQAVAKVASGVNKQSRVARSFSHAPAYGVFILHMFIQICQSDAHIDR